MKNLRLVNLIIVFFFLLITSSCQKENRCDCFKRTGKIETELRDVKGFDKVWVEDNISLIISEDSVFEVKIESGDNLIPLIKTEVIDGTLFIRNKNRCNWTRSYKKPFNVYVKMPKIKFITSNTTGNITNLNTITSDSLGLDAINSGDIELTIQNHSTRSHQHGSGDIILHGQTHDYSSNISGTCFLNCQDFKTNYTYIESHTTGISNVAATDLLICLINDLGDVYCYQNPASVVKTVKGSGALYLK